MSQPLRHDSLTLRLVLPVVGLVLAGVLLNVAFSAWLATRRATAAAREREARVAAALAEKRVALSPAVLAALAALTGSEFVVWDPAARRAGATSLPPETLAGASDAALAEAIAAGRIDFASSSYRIGVVRAAGVLWLARDRSCAPRAMIALPSDAALPPIETTAASIMPSTATSSGCMGGVAGRLTTNSLVLRSSFTGMVTE